jgi:hypothetical protein
MELKYAVVSSNSNPEYLDFWPYVARAWKNLIGLEPVLLYIDKDSPPSWVHEHGRVFYLESIKDWDIVQQAQSIRFWAARLIDSPFIISDMDMLPISKEYYINGVSDLGVNAIASYSSDIIKYRWYRTNPQYPMCYLAGDPKSFIDLLDLKDDSHFSFLRRLKNMNIRYGTDQKFFYNQTLRKQKDYIKHMERGWIEEKYATGRLDKAIWPKPGYNPMEYIDCHLPRPYLNNKNICDELFNKLNIV